VPDFPIRDVFGPLGWTFVGLLGANLLFFIVLIALREHWLLYERRRAKIREGLEPVIERLVEGRDREDTTAELKRIVARHGRTGGPVAAWLLRDLTRDADAETHVRVRKVLDECGAIDAAEEGTRRWMPWRRALACEILGTIGAERSVPVLIERLGDDRLEVRMAAARALGAIGAPQAGSALTSAFLERTAVPTGVAYDALRSLGSPGVDAFVKGLDRADPTVRVASCFGIGATAGGETAVTTLTRVIERDDNVRVRTAAIHALGVIGGEAPSPALLRAARDPELRVRREAVESLGSFDDPGSVQALAESLGDRDREIALRSATSLLALGDRPRAGAAARAALDASRAWSVDYVRTIKELAA
jgi:HEAT repeat protein